MGVLLNSRRAANSLVRLVAGDERWEVPGPPTGCFPQNWGGTELNCTVTCMVLKWYWARTHDMPAMIRYLDHWATADPEPSTGQR
ncbi:hypothetical protein TNCV_1884921 [Trichonephila clavipes]|nr:hypothetical protein TNCV_1884921 [Trichonephila clavipes]